MTTRSDSIHDILERYWKVCRSLDSFRDADSRHWKWNYIRADEKQKAPQAGWRGGTHLDGRFDRVDVDLGLQADGQFGETRLPRRRCHLRQVRSTVGRSIGIHWVHT